MLKKSILKKQLLCALSVLLPLISFAQNADVEMADFMHENGKIYVVIGVLLIIFLIIIGFLMYIEKRLRDLENK